MKMNISGALNICELSSKKKQSAPSLIMFALTVPSVDLNVECTAYTTIVLCLKSVEWKSNDVLSSVWEELVDKSVLGNMNEGLIN